MDCIGKRTIQILLLVLVPTAVVLANSVSKDYSEFDARCFGKPDGFGYRNPSNCAEFYHCTYGRSILKQCPASTYYDDEKQVCDHAENVDCSPIEEVVDCEAAKNGDIFPNPNDCTTFYICSYQKAVLFHCDQFLMFDRTQSNCNWADLEKCPEAGRGL